MKRFINRDEAGDLLSEKLVRYFDKDAIVIAIPRGGVPVGYRISKKLNLPLDIILVKKLGHPYNREFAIGAVTLQNFYVDHEYKNIDKLYIEDEVKRIRESLKEKYRSYLGDRSPLNVNGKTVIIVDDGIASGNTMLAGIKILRKSSPSRIIAATPLVPFENIELIKNAVDDFVYIYAPKFFPCIGSFYEEFRQINDEEVIHILNNENLKMIERNKKIRERHHSF